MGIIFDIWLKKMVHFNLVTMEINFDIYEKIATVMCNNINSVIIVFLYKPIMII